MSKEREATIRLKWSDERRAYQLDHGKYRFWFTCRIVQQGTETFYSLDTEEIAKVVHWLTTDKIQVETIGVG